MPDPGTGGTGEPTGTGGSSQSNTGGTSGQMPGQPGVTCSGDVTGGPALSADHPNMYLNAGEIAAISAQIEADAQPWKDAYDDLLSRASAALNQTPVGVTEVGRDSPAYYTERPYCGWTPEASPCGGDACCDGQINPNADRADYEAAIDMSRAIRDLGIAYAFTGQANYASHAITLINHWAVNEATRANPGFTDAQSEIELSITIPAMFYGADLIWNFSGWDAAERDAFVQWTRDFAENARNKSDSVDANNFGDWRLVLLAAAASLVKDDELMQYVVDHYKAMVPNQIDGGGRWVKELGRTRGLHYSLYAANALVQVAEIVRHQGVDLYNFESSSGTGSLKKGIDWLLPFVLDQSSWPYEQLDALTEDNIDLFEFAYLTWQEDGYLEVFDQWPRPLYDIRTAGPATLTHAFGAYPWTLEGGGQIPLSIQTMPAGNDQPYTVVFSATSSDSDLTFDWDFGDGETSSDASPTHTYDEPGCYDVQLTTTSADGDEETANTSVVLVDPDAEIPIDDLNSSVSWNGQPVGAQTGTFTIEFDLTPAQASMDGVVGLSDGAASGYGDLAVAVRMNDQGYLDARNGGAYEAASQVQYAANQTIHVRMVVNVGSKTYDVFVTPEGGDETALAQGYSFRTEQSAVTQLDTLVAQAEDGSHSVTAIALSTP